MDRFILDRDRAVLVVVDIQERLAVVMEHREKVVINTAHLIHAAELMEIPIVVTEQYPKGLGPTVPEIMQALPKGATIEPVEKITFDCCGEPAFLSQEPFKSRTQVILTGMEAHICVLQTALGLLHEGLVVHMVRDAVCSRTKENFQAGLQMARDAGAVITTTEIALFQLLKRAGTEHFKAISKRIK